MNKPVVDHIGVIVADLDATIAMFERLFGGAPASVKEMPEVGLKVAVFEAANVAIELLQYTGANDELAKRVMGQAPGVNHISFGVGKLAEAIAELEAAGARTMDGFPRQGAHGRVAFFEPASTGGVLFEVCEPQT
jgi:methylmalonyl-CoA/ethylmalonyl-CoA epimerase